MAEAVRKVLLAPVYTNGVLVPGTPADPLKNFALTLSMEMENEKMGGVVPNEVLGADLRAATKAVRMIEMGFKKLKDYVPAPAATGKPVKHNKGR